MVVEPATGETPSENLHLLGGIFYGYSTLISLPASKVQEFGLGSDAQAGEKRIPLVVPRVMRHVLVFMRPLCDCP